MQDAAKKMRTAPTILSISAGTLAATARGIVARDRPSVLAANEGPLKLGKDWARKTMKKWDWKPLSRRPPEIFQMKL